MAALTIFDSILVPRTVEIPDACPNPKCGASFTSGSNLIEWDRAEVQYYGNLTAGAYDIQNEHNRGDTFHPIAYYCSSCRHPIADGLLHEAEPCDLDASVRKLIDAGLAPEGD